MNNLFTATQLNAQLLRTISYTYCEGADIGECLSTAEHIKESEWDSWYENWLQTAQRIEQSAETSKAAGNLISARQAYLRASNYYRTAFFFLHGQPVDPRLVQAYQSHIETFAKAAELFSHPVEAVRIPFENTSLPGYFYRADSSDVKRPVIIVNGGNDTTQQECYLTFANAALKRGYHVLCFDGPGQGESLIKENLYMRPDWEKVISPVVDFLIKQPEVKSNAIILIGLSWGGWLAARAAAFEHRLAGLIANPGQFDALENIKKSCPELTTLLDHDENLYLEKFMAQALANPFMAFKFKSKMWVHGVESPVELLRAWQAYNLAGISQNIRCPSLILNAENEQYCPGQAEELYETLTCPKDYFLFPSSEGAGEHCAAGALSFFHQKAFDWLEQLLAPHFPLPPTENEPLYSM
ncbi:alpha/beta fold hydrolase [Parachlamydia sp. AcF125]|uniref:alpha/beta hydrolase family protein n=1 Tax=Parachlamydia sp. AcF125 TaxID=2795736 RepID=UPI001BC8DDB4|nr:alpha/beta fold hydrolase [Parachlamydia sp. AcF125]MBS4168408.1 2,6-dihydropseudooxynicotine hydrolase [Parachlamydia sp. AcF125]